MKVRTLNAKLHVKEAVRKSSGRVDLVHIPATLIISACFAYLKYKEYLDGQKYKESE